MSSRHKHTKLLRASTIVILCGIVGIVLVMGRQFTKKTKGQTISVPDHVAQEIFLRSITVRPHTGELESRRASTLTNTVGLEDSELQQLKSIANDFANKIAVFDATARQIKDNNWPTPSAAVMAQLTALQRQREALVAETWTMLATQLKPESMVRLSTHLNDHIRSKIKPFPGPPLPSKGHH